MKLRKIFGVSAIAGALLVVVVFGTAGSQRSNQRMIEPMTNKMITMCMGRFLLELPEGALVDFQSARVARVQVHMEPAHNQPTAMAAIKHRTDELGQQTNEYGGASLEKEVDVDAVNFTAKVLYYGRIKAVRMFEQGKQIPTTDRVNVEALGFHDNRLYRFRGELFESGVDDGSVNEVIKRFESTPENFIPNQPGFCTEAGILHEPISPRDVEHLTVFVSLKDTPTLQYD